MKQNRNKTRFIVSIEPELLNKLNEHCEKNGKSRSKLVCIIIDNYLKNEEITKKIVDEIVKKEKTKE